MGTFCCTLDIFFCFELVTIIQVDVLNVSSMVTILLYNGDGLFECQYKSLMSTL